MACLHTLPALLPLPASVPIDTDYYVSAFSSR
jgi:hypothetical protein